MGTSGFDPSRDPDFDPKNPQYWASKINACLADHDRCKREAQFLRRLAGHKKVSREASLVELPLAKHLKALGHDIKRQARCQMGRVDIFDRTTNEMIECKMDGSVDLIVQAAKQLKDYELCFPRSRKVIAVPMVNEDARWMGAALVSVGFSFIEVSKL